MNETRSGMSNGEDGWAKNSLEIVATSWPRSRCVWLRSPWHRAALHLFQFLWPPLFLFPASVRACTRGTHRGKWATPWRPFALVARLFGGSASHRLLRFSLARLLFSLLSQPLALLRPLPSSYVYRVGPLRPRRCISAARSPSFPAHALLEVRGWNGSENNRFELS